MTQNTRKIAVLTGDLVNSTGLGPVKIERAFAALEDCAATQAEWMGESLHFTRHRGDGWQVALAEPKYALRSALAFRAALRAQGEEFDSYIGIAEGEVEGEIGPDLNEETDEVFVWSGLALETTKSLKDGITRMFYLDNRTKAAATILADSLARRWSTAQAQALTQVISPLKRQTLTEIGEHLGKSRQAVAKSLDAANYISISTALSVIEGKSINA